MYQLCLQLHIYQNTGSIEIQLNIVDSFTLFPLTACFLPEWTLAEDEVNSENSVGGTRQLKERDVLGLLSVGNSSRRQQNDAILTLTHKQKCIFFILDSCRGEMIMTIWVPQL